MSHNIHRKALCVVSLFECFSLFNLFDIFTAVLTKDLEKWLLKLVWTYTNISMVISIYYFCSLCKVDVTYFPFDTQICVLKFGSWAYNGLELNVTNLSDSGDLGSFVTNVEWEVNRLPLQRHVIKYGCCPEPYPDVTFYVVLERKPLFYILNLLFPCMLISTVACLGFLLPPDSGEKVSLEITVLLSLAVFLLVVSETMPPSSETFPFIGNLFFILVFWSIDEVYKSFLFHLFLGHNISIIWSLITSFVFYTEQGFILPVPCCWFPSRVWWQ